MTTRIETERPRPWKHTPGRVRLARCIAIAADAIQFGFFPLFAEGFASPLNIALDIFVCLTMIALLGFHVAFLPSFLFEAFPVLDLAPTWTIAVFVVTRRGPVPTAKPQPPVIDV